MRTAAVSGTCVCLINVPCVYPAKLVGVKRFFSIRNRHSVTGGLATPEAASLEWEGVDRKQTKAPGEGKQRDTGS